MSLYAILHMLQFSNGIDLRISGSLTNATVVKASLILIACASKQWIIGHGVTNHSIWTTPQGRGTPVPIVEHGRTTP
jgi:hypothetical protein